MMRDSRRKNSLARTGAVARTFILCSLTLLVVRAFAEHSGKTILMRPNGFAVSEPLTELPIDLPLFVNREMPEPRPTHFRAQSHIAPIGPDPVLQREDLPQVGVKLGVSFDGIAAQGFAPSDSNLAVGPSHIVETANVQFAVYSKTGTLLSGPTNFTTLFDALGNNCGRGSSDPIVNYDRMADRWVISDIAYTSSAPFLECYAISSTNDPTGAYFLYSFNFGNSLNDYPKVSVWATASNSAYLSSYNIFANGGILFIGASLCGFDRDKALAGDKTAAQLCQMTHSSQSSFLPGDMDGPTPPADGTPGLFITWHNNNPGQLLLRKLTLNFSAGTSSLSPKKSISVANDSLACVGCVPQLGTRRTLDTMGDRLMYRFAIRHFADHDRAVFNHAVGNGSRVAFRWYEIYDPAGTATVNQQGTYAPDGTYRWMGSMAEDQNGDVAVGYSASSSSMHPAIRFTGRVPSDPAGSLESEASIVEGAGSQTGNLSRWGDYTALQVDPSDDCTFWYVDQYQPTSGSFNWATKIASFKFKGCGGTGTPGATLVR